MYTQTQVEIDRDTAEAWKSRNNVLVWILKDGIKKATMKIKILSCLESICFFERCTLLKDC